MLQLLANFYYNLFFNDALIQDEDFLISEIMSTPIELFGVQYNVAYYLTFLCSLISLIFIIVLCCLFVWKIIKLIGGLIR